MTFFFIVIIRGGSRSRHRSATVPPVSSVVVGRVEDERRLALRRESQHFGDVTGSERVVARDHYYLQRRANTFMKVETYTSIAHILVRF